MKRKRIDEQMSEYHVDIVTVTHNSSHCFDRFLKGLLNGAHEDVSLTVVDNQSLGEEVSRMQTSILGLWPNEIRWIDSGYNIPYHHCQSSPDPETDAYGYSINIGLRKVEGPYVLAINPDCFGDYEEEWLHRALALYQAFSVGIMGAVLLNSQGTINHAGGGADPGVHIGRDGVDLPEYNYMRPVKWVTGAWHFASKDLLEKVGYYKKGTAWASDGQLCINAANAGYPCYCAPIRLYHNEMESSDPERYEQNLRSKLG